MEKLDSIRKGQIWLTVFRTDDGEIAITFCKSYPTTQGWKKTNFLRPEVSSPVKNGPTFRREADPPYRCTPNKIKGRRYTIGN